MDQHIIDLLDFLHDPKIEVRAIALHNIVAFTDKTSPHYPLLVNRAQTLVPDLKALCREDPITAHDAIRSLINLSSDQNVCKELNDEKFIKHLTLLITVSKSILADLACMLLSNLTKYEPICTGILDATAKPMEGLSSSFRLIDHLVDAFVKGVDKAYNPEAEFHFLASVFANLTSLPKGRFAFIDKAKYDNLSPLNKLVCFTEHQNIIRRGGVISTIKYVLMSSKTSPLRRYDIKHYWIPRVSTFCRLSCCRSVDLRSLIWTYVYLRTLLLDAYYIHRLTSFQFKDMEAFPEEIQLLPDDKKREPDPLLRAMLCESLLLLTTTREGRDDLRAKKVYAVIQRMHLSEEDERVQDVCERIVQMLKRDEDEENEKIVEMDEEDDLKMEEIA
ncbi:hypothetical protein BC938DRAFT_481820 [Jimgerdemannia flammicorona]|uniref:Protein HGH1 homolog n=1 Tax=Jimgerdemannia flammicorona TaxID=994334 RepID=A0A433QFY9_9FUNG|nr:hypothetical protein BC938DRAFT_481820 [Jimgerdemannia flammicorona]